MNAPNLWDYRHGPSWEVLDMPITHPEGSGEPIEVEEVPFTPENIAAFLEALERFGGWK
jgi:hypothetical protein